MGIIFASGFLYQYLLYVQKPLSTSLRDEKDKKGMQGRVKLPCTGYMRLLASRCVMHQFMVIPAMTVSYCLFHEILGLCVNVSMPLRLFSIILPSAWCLSIVTDGRTSSDWLLGPMLVCVHLGVICVVIGLSLMFLVFFVYVFDKGNLFISVLSQHAHHKVNPNIFQFYFNFSTIFCCSSMHPFFCDLYDFYLVFLHLISPIIIY